MRTRVNFRINSTIQKLIALWKDNPELRLHSKGKPVSIAKQISLATQHVIRLWVQQSISELEIKQVSGLSDGGTKFYRVDLDADIHTVASALIADTTLSLSEVIRAGILLAPELTTRKTLEQKYLNQGGVGDPVYMSDDFLHLWCKFKNEGPATDGVRIVRAIRDLEVRFQATIKKLDRLDKVFDTYGIKGILNSESAPKKEDILALEGKALRALCRRWQVPLASQTPDGVIRRELLTKFGYQQEIIS